MKPSNNKGIKKKIIDLSNLINFTIVSEWLPSLKQNKKHTNWKNIWQLKFTNILDFILYSIHYRECVTLRDVWGIWLIGNNPRIMPAKLWDMSYDTMVTKGLRKRFHFMYIEEHNAYLKEQVNSQKLSEVLLKNSKKQVVLKIHHVIYFSQPLLTRQFCNIFSTTFQLF